MLVAQQNIPIIAQVVVLNPFQSFLLLFSSFYCMSTQPLPKIRKFLYGDIAHLCIKDNQVLWVGKSSMAYQAHILSNYQVSGSPSCIPNTLPHSFPIFPYFLLPMLECTCLEIAELVPTVCVRIHRILDSACQECQTPATSGTTNIGFLKNQSCEPWQYVYPRKATDEENPFTTLE